MITVHFICVAITCGFIGLSKPHMPHTYVTINLVYVYSGLYEHNTLSLINEAMASTNMKKPAALPDEQVTEALLGNNTQVFFYTDCADDHAQANKVVNNNSYQEGHVIGLHMGGYDKS
jgi:hypothetical protein